MPLYFSTIMYTLLGLHINTRDRAIDKRVIETRQSEQTTRFSNGKISTSYLPYIDQQGR